MDTEKLRALILAAEEGSLSGAARRLGLTISTISRKIMDLEHEVGATLLLRTGRGVRLTPQGQGLVEHARELLRGLDQALAMARTTERAALTHLRLSAPVELALTLLPQIIASLHLAHPALIIEVISEARRAALFEDGFDAAIRLGPLQDTSLLARPLGHIRLGLCGPSSLLAHSPQGLGAQALEALRLVGVVGAADPVAGSLHGHHLTMRSGPLRVSTFSEAAQVAALTGQAAILPSFTAASALRAGQLALLAPSLALPQTQAHLLLLPRHRHDAALLELTTLLRAALTRADASLGPAPDFVASTDQSTHL